VLASRNPGRSHGWRRYLAFAGPAIVASIAYMDPGNFATNIEAGSRYGYGLLWMVLLANLVAMLTQALSAKLGIVTGATSPNCPASGFPPPLVWTMWAVSEVAAMATDLAEYVGLREVGSRARGRTKMSMAFDIGWSSIDIRSRTLAARARRSARQYQSSVSR
jgi:Mn2+/Fe2+ NRAMP family transporter